MKIGIMSDSHGQEKAVKIAVSIAALLLTTKYIITEEVNNDFIIPMPV